MWDLKVIDTEKTLYVAIADALERDILAGILRAGDKLPTHRDLARIVGVTITTITRAYAEAKRRNLVTAIVGKGTFVAADAGVAASLINITASKNTYIEMALVHPLFEEERHLKEVIAKLLEHDDLNKYVVYSFPQGLPRHREVGAKWVGRFGVTASSKSIIVTSGTQHALHCIFSTLFEPGDRIAVDYLTYPGVKLAARNNGVLLEAVAMDSAGMIPDDLEAACKRHTIKGVYASGTMQNPTNYIMTAERRQAIAKMIKKNNLLLIEDGVYDYLAPSRSTLSALVPHNSVYIAGLAKAFYSGLRVAFVAVPPSLTAKITQGVVDSIWMASPLCTEIACEAIESKIADKIIKRKKDELDRRIVLFNEIMRGFSFHLPKRSMFCWLELPAGWTGTEFEKAAAEKGVRVLASEKFIVGHIAPPDYIRIAISAPSTIESYVKGLRILVSLLQQPPEHSTHGEGESKENKK